MTVHEITTKLPTFEGRATSQFGEEASAAPAVSEDGKRGSQFVKSGLDLQDIERGRQTRSSSQCPPKHKEDAASPTPRVQK